MRPGQESRSSHCSLCNFGQSLNFSEHHFSYLYEKDSTVYPPGHHWNFRWARSRLYGKLNASQSAPKRRHNELSPWSGAPGGGPFPGNLVD